MKNNKEKNDIGLRVFLITLIVLMLAIIAALVVWIVTQFDKSEITQNNSSSDISSSSLSSSQSDNDSTVTSEDIDTEIIRQNYAYSEVTSDMMYKGILAAGELTEDYVPDDLRLLYNALFSDDGLQIASEKSTKFKCAKEALQPLNDMLKAFYADTGYRTLMINAAYEQHEEDTDDSSSYEQDYYYGGYYDEYGNYIPYDYTDSQTESDEEDDTCGEHENGLSFDLGIYDSESGSFTEIVGRDEYKWFYSNAYKYGFVVRYPDGKEEFTGYEFSAAHFRYVGEAAAKIMHENNLCLEEYIERMKSYSYDSPLITDVNEECVMCWYIADSGLDTTSIQIPSINGIDAEYTVSGNGSDGYIITAVLTKDYAYSTDTGSDSVQDSN